MAKTNVKLWDKMATSYDKRFQKMYQEIFATILPLMQSDDEVIELGCGSGLVSFEIIPKVRKFVGTDLSKKMIQVATEKLQHTAFTNANFVEGDALQIGNIGQFSKVLLINLLHVIDTPLELLRHVRPLVKSSGEIIVLSYCHGEKMTPKYKLLSSLMWLGSKLGLMSKLQRFTFPQLRQMAVEAGYTIANAMEVRHGFPFMCLQLKI